MSEKRKDYIDQLLSDLKLLEDRLLSVKESDTLPFSFFSTSFDRLEKISRSFHELELMQIGEMKEQMERLVRFLSESDGRNSAVRQSESFSSEKPEEETPENQEEVLNNESEMIALPVNQPSDSPVQAVSGMDDVVIEQERVGFAGRIILPEYKDPRITHVAPPLNESSEHTGKNGQEKPVMRSLNDIIQAPPALLDLRRGISLNDRFLFQRELFNNNRDEMNSVMDRLNALASFAEAESYLRSERSWNFEDQTVKDFLLIIKKGFE